MKTISLITPLSILSIPALAKIEVPTKAKDGFVNVNNRKEYDFSNYPNEKIWHEFGRPFWKATPKKAEVSAPVKAEAPKVVDTDRDGIEDSLDQCPNTMANTVVNSFGCKPKENKVSDWKSIYKMDFKKKKRHIKAKELLMSEFDVKKKVEKNTTKNTI